MALAKEYGLYVFDLTARWWTRGWISPARCKRRLGEAAFRSPALRM